MNEQLQPQKGAPLFNPWLPEFMPILILFLIGCAKALGGSGDLSGPRSLDCPPDIRPLSFRGDIHHYVGAQLARIEAETAIATILRRLPNLRLDDSRGEQTS